MQVWNNFTFNLSDNALKIINVPMGFRCTNYSYVKNQRDAKEAFDFIRNFKELSPKSFMVFGNVNTGKTVLGTCMIKQLVAAQRGWGLYVSFMNLLDSKKVNFSGDEIWEECFTTDLLVIDDIGYEDFESGLAGKILLRILKQRSDNLKSTIFVMQINPEQIKTKYGSAVLENFVAKCSNWVTG